MVDPTDPNLRDPTEGADLTDPTEGTDLTDPTHEQSDVQDFSIDFDDAGRKDQTTQASQAAPADQRGKLRPGTWPIGKCSVCGKIILRETAKDNSPIDGAEKNGSDYFCEDCLFNAVDDAGEAEEEKPGRISTGGSENKQPGRIVDDEDDDVIHVDPSLFPGEIEFGPLTPPPPPPQPPIDEILEELETEGKDPGGGAPSPGGGGGGESGVSGGGGKKKDKNPMGDIPLPRIGDPGTGSSKSAEDSAEGEEPSKKDTPGIEPPDYSDEEKKFKEESLKEAKDRVENDELGTIDELNEEYKQKTKEFSKMDPDECIAYQAEWQEDYYSRLRHDLSQEPGQQKVTAVGDETTVERLLGDGTVQITYTYQVGENSTVQAEIWQYPDGKEVSWFRQAESQMSGPDSSSKIVDETIQIYTPPRTHSIYGEAISRQSEGIGRFMPPHLKGENIDFNEHSGFLSRVSESDIGRILQDVQSKHRHGPWERITQ